MRSFFLYFLLWVKDLVIFELRFGFLVKNCIYGRGENVWRSNFELKNEEYAEMLILAFLFFILVVLKFNVLASIP